MSNNFPSIGDIQLDPSDKFKENGVDKYDLLLCDGGAVPGAIPTDVWEFIDHEFTMSPASTPYGVCSHEGLLYTVSYSGVQEVRVCDRFGRVLHNYPAQDSTGLSDICTDGTFLYLLSFDGRKVHRCTLDGQGMVELVSSLPAGLVSPNGMTITSTGFAILDYTGQLFYYTLQGGFINSASSSSLEFGRGIAWNEGGFYWLVTNTLLKQLDLDLNTLPGKTFNLTTAKNNGVCIDNNGVRTVDTDGFSQFLSDVERLPYIPSPDPQTPYRIVADLTQGN